MLAMKWRVEMRVNLHSNCLLPFTAGSCGAQLLIRLLSVQLKMQTERQLLTLKNPATFSLMMLKDYVF